MATNVVNKERFAINPFQSGVANNASFTIGAEATNAITVAVRLRDGNKNIDQRATVQCYLSSDINGDVLTALATPTFTAGTNGSVATLIAGRMAVLISEANGTVDLIITYTTGAGTVYLVLIMPDGTLKVSSAITFA